MTARLPLLALIALTVSSQPDPAEAEIRATRPYPVHEVRALLQP